ncbi:MAG: sodium:solute symporter [Bacteroidota bacterium]
MTPLDWIIIIAYLMGMIGLSVYLGRGQKDEEDYYVGGRSLPWWAVGISTMATQTSAISFISIPAFIALREGGGLTWLQYELAVPLAMILVMVLLIPTFRALKLVSVYEYLELRFGASVRTLVSGVFLVSRGLATGVGVYASGIVLSVCLGTPLWVTILIIGAVTILYDTIGGITAVVYSDVIQMVILLGGIVVCIAYAAAEVGGLGAMLGALPAERLQTLDLSTGLGDGGDVPFWAFLFGGFFLYASYYGTDQSQVQRELSAKSIREAKLALLLNGLARFPLTLLYAALGIAAYAAYAASPELQASVPADRPDFLIPQFILLNLPTGLRALLFAALLSAAMSSLDSALNSLSAATMRDFLDSRLPSETSRFQWSKLTTVAWGVLITGFAFVVGEISDTVIEGINKIGSAFFGPVLAAFLVGVLSRRVEARGLLVGILVGVGFNLVQWIAFPEIYWMWWNAVGCGVAAGVAALVSRLSAQAETAPPDPTPYTVWAEGSLLERERAWRPVYALLIGYFILMLGVLVAIPRLA